MTNTSLSFKILYHTNFYEEGSIIDLQIITNVSSLNDCLDACALDDSRMRLEHFPTNAWTGVAWGSGSFEAASNVEWPVCWLKGNVTRESLNASSPYPLPDGATDGAVLLNI